MYLLEVNAEWLICFSTENINLIEIIIIMLVIFPRNNNKTDSKRTPIRVSGDGIRLEYRMYFEL